MLRGCGIIAVIAVGQIVATEPLAAQTMMAELLPPYEAHAIVRSMGLRVITAPVRQGSTYVLRAVDRYGEERRVVLDARYGDVLSAVPVVRLPGNAYPGARVVRLPRPQMEHDEERDAALPPANPPPVISAPRSANANPAAPPVPRPRPAGETNKSGLPVAQAKPSESSPVEAAPGKPAAPAESNPVDAKQPSKPAPVFVPDAAPLD
ncbi:MAG: hypothetical protein AB7K04_14270 [Pseudorhodoplanes sp.]